MMRSKGTSHEDTPANWAVPSHTRGGPSPPYPTELEERRAASAHPSKVLMMRSFACIPFFPPMVLALCLPSSALGEVLQITSQYTGQINGVPIEATGTGQMDTTGNSVNSMEIEFQSIPDSIHPFALGNCWNSTYHKNAVLPLEGALNLWSLTGEEGNYTASRSVSWFSLPGEEIEIIADVTTEGGVMTANQAVNGTYSGPTDLIGVTDYEAIWTQIGPTTVELSVTATILRANGESFEADITQVYSGLSVQMPTDQQFSTLTFSDHSYSNNILSICWQGTVTPVQIIPTVSEWGLVVLTLLGLTIGTIVLGRRWRMKAAG